MNARTNNRFAPSSTHSPNRVRTRTLAILAGAAACATVAPHASAQDFFGMVLNADMRSIVPVGISGSGESTVIAYKAINERGVQVYDAPGLLEISTGVFHELPVPLDGDGDYQSAEIFQFRQSPQRGPADPVKGIDIGLIKKPTPTAAMWDTTEGIENTVWYTWIGAGVVASEARSASMDGSTVVGTVFTDLSGSASSVRAVSWNGTGGDRIAQEFSMPPEFIGSEARGTSSDGSVAVGVAYRAIKEQGLGVIWTGGGSTVIGPEAAGPDAVSLELTGISDNGNMAMGRVKTSDKHQAMVVNDPTGTDAWNESDLEFSLLDGGDINGDGNIDLMDDHDSAALALSADGSVVGGSVTIFGETLAALWIMGSGGTYAYHDVGTYLSNLGSTGQDGWTLREVTGVSADGSMITGVGVNSLGQTTGWYATIPAPGSIALLGLGGLLATRKRR